MNHNNDLVRSAIWSVKEKKNKFKTISRKGRTDEEIDKIIEDFKNKIKEENEKIKKDKEQQIEPVLQKEPEKKTLKELIKMNFEKDTGSVFLVMGTSKSGKTTLTIKILNILDEFDNKFIPMIMAGNMNNPLYPKSAPIFNGFQPQLVEILKIINENTSAKKQYRFLIVIDDILDLKGSQTLKNLLLSYRNNNLSTVINIQNPVLIRKDARSNPSMFFFGHMGSMEEIEAIMKRFLGSTDIFLKLNMMEKIRLYKSLTMNHQFLVFLPMVHSNLIFTI